MPGNASNAQLDAFARSLIVISLAFMPSVLD
jgi:hypothetical protein